MADVDLNQDKWPHPKRCGSARFHLVFWRNGQLTRLCAPLKNTLTKAATGATA